MKNSFFYLPNLLATWFGGGLVPFAPGTAGALVALPGAYLISYFTGAVGLGIGVIIVFFLGVWVANIHYQKSGSHDSKEVVIDEVAGQWLTLLLVPADVVFYVIGFVLFRIADIAKPWPINIIDRKINNGLGVMLDDLVAGAISAIILWNIWMWTNL